MRFTLMLALLAPALVLAAGWDDVRGIAPDHRIEVQTRDRKTIRARFVSATDAALVARTESGEQSIARPDIRRVRVADPSRRVRSTLIRGGIGAGAGLAAGFAVCPQCQSEGAGAKYMGPFTALGAGIGAVWGLAPAPFRTVYKAR